MLLLLFNATVNAAAVEMFLGVAAQWIPVFEYYWHISTVHN